MELLSKTLFNYGTNKKSQGVFVFSTQKHEKVKIFVAVPRSNSTIIEFILDSSTSISKIIHEPFIDFGYYNAEAFFQLTKNFCRYQYW